MLEDKLVVQKQIKALETQRNHKRRSLFDAQDKVDSQRDEMIGTIEARYHNQRRATSCFGCVGRWSELRVVRRN